jgi:hypothetical protein
MARHGILYLDELPELKRVVLEVLRQPLADGKLTNSRAAASLTYPPSRPSVRAYRMNDGLSRAVRTLGLQRAVFRAVRCSPLSRCS